MINSSLHQNIIAAEGGWIVTNILYMSCNYIVLNLLGEPSKWSSNRMIPGFVTEVVRVTRYNQSEKSVIWRGICRWG